MTTDDLSTQAEADAGWEECYVVNRAGLKALGYESCSGATLVDMDGDAQVYPIVGVIDDYYDGRITSGVRPMVFIVSRSTSGNVFQMAVHPGRLPAVLDYLRKLEREAYGTEEFEYYMFSDRVGQMYESDRQTLHLFYNNNRAMIYKLLTYKCLGVNCTLWHCATSHEKRALSHDSIRVRVKVESIKKEKCGCFRHSSFKISVYADVVPLSFGLDKAHGVFGNHQLFIGRNYTYGNFAVRCGNDGFFAMDSGILNLVD